MTSPGPHIRNYLLVTAFALAAVLPIVFQGMPGGNDSVQHFTFAQQVYDGFREGHVFPSFAGNSNHGFGDTGLRVYPPLAYYALAGAYGVSGDWFAASAFVFCLIFLLGGLGIYKWVREILSEREALAAAAVFTFAPFHLNEIYNNFLFAQFAASALLPFCFLFVHRASTRGRLADSLGLSVAYGLLITTHLPTTIIGSVALLIYGVFTSGRDTRKRFLPLARGVAGGLLLSAFYWVRLVTESDLVKHSDPKYFSEIWSYSENFLFSPTRLADPGVDSLGLWFGDLMLVAILLISLPSFVLIARSRSSAPQTLRPVAAAFLFAVFMTIPLSVYLWDLLPLLQKVQFPWRWLSVLSVTGAALSSYGLVRVSDGLRTSRNLLLPLGLGSILLSFAFLSAFVIRVPHYTLAADFKKGAETFSSAETFEGWWPKWADRTTFGASEKILANERDYDVHSWNTQERTFVIGGGEPLIVSTATFYYPHWKVFVNGEAVDSFPDNGGRLAFHVGSERSNVVASFVEPVFVRIAAVVSLLGWIAAFLLGLFLFRPTAAAQS